MSDSLLGRYGLFWVLPVALAALAGALTVLLFAPTKKAVRIVYKEPVRINNTMSAQEVLMRFKPTKVYKIKQADGTVRPCSVWSDGVTWLAQLCTRGDQAS